MNGNTQKLIKYLDGASKRFIIPVYQRNYDWKMEHCKQLYDDLVKVIRQNRKSHFLGTIINKRPRSVHSHIESLPAPRFRGKREYPFSKCRSHRTAPQLRP